MGYTQTLLRTRLVVEIYISKDMDCTLRHCIVFKYTIGSGGSLQFTIVIMIAAAVINRLSLNAQANNTLSRKKLSRKLYIQLFPSTIYASTYTHNYSYYMPWLFYELQLFQQAKKTFKDYLVSLKVC